MIKAEWEAMSASVTCGAVLKTHTGFNSCTRGSTTSARDLPCCEGMREGEGEGEREREREGERDETPKNVRAVY